MSKLLFDENPLVVNTGLAVKIGLNEAIILQQIHYWLEINKKAKRNFRDNETWCYNTYKKWQEQFPFFSLKTIQRTIISLENMGFLITGNYNKLKIDKTKWYRINYKTLENVSEFTKGHFDLSKKSKRVVEEVILTKPLPEISSEINYRDYHSIKGAFSNEKTLSIRYKSKEEFLNRTNYAEDTSQYKVCDYIYNYFYSKINTNHYKLDNEQFEKVREGIDLILQTVEKYPQLEELLERYFNLQRKYYSIQDFTNLNTLSYLLSITGIAEIPERFDKDGKFEGIV